MASNDPISGVLEDDTEVDINILTTSSADSLSTLSSDE